MTKSSERYNADEQADITQTEAEEWATEIALRIKEGNLDPIPVKKSKNYEQHDFTYVSLFSGIGGFEQALNRFGGTCVFASEIDKFASQAYKTLYGEKPAGDITKIDAKDIPNHDLLVGGFPCQAFSVAGKRKGFEDTRGTLFFEIARIAKKKQPKALLLENVKGLVNHDKGRTLDIMIETLNEIGYTVDFNVLNSKYFGVPQNRERIFIVAIRDDLIEQEKWSEEATKGQTVVPRGKRRLTKYEWLKSFNFDWPEQDEVVTRLRDILETEVDEKYYLDEEKTARLAAQLEDIERVSDDINQVDNIDQYKRKRNNPQTGRIYGYGGMSPALSTMQGGGLEPKIVEEQGLPIREATKKGYAIAEEGDSVNVQFPNSKTRRGRVGKQIANTLEASSINQGVVEKENEDGVAIGNPPKYRIRKLTPKECLRLQAFPDEAFDKLKDAGISDSQLYKMSGNAVTTSVVEAIAKRLIPLIS